jgi:hypothetical protein
MARGRDRTQVCGAGQAHYGFISVTVPELKRSLRQAKRLVEFAETVLQRSTPP